jgi:hypothetical protein
MPAGPFGLCESSCLLPAHRITALLQAAHPLPSSLFTSFHYLQTLRHVTAEPISRLRRLTTLRHRPADCPLRATRVGTTLAPAWPSRLPPRLLHTPCRLRPSRASSDRLSCCHRACHGPCYILAALGHVPRHALRGWRCPPLHAVCVRKARAVATLPSRALLWTRTTFRCVAGEPTLFPSSPLRGSPNPVLCAASAAVTQAAKRCRECERGCPCRQLVRQRLRLITRATVIRNVNACSPLPKAMNRASRAVTVHAHALARATRIGHANGDPTRYKDPALLTELAEKPSSAPAPLAVWLRHFNARHAEAWQAPVVPVSGVAGPHAAHAPRQRLTQACAPGQPVG